MVHLEKLYESYKGRAAFVFVNIHEASHRMEGFDYLLEGQNDVTPEGQEFRRQCVRKASRQSKLSIPVFLDHLDESAMMAYGAWPARLVVVGRDGNIARDFGSVIDQEWPINKLRTILDEQCAGPTSGLQ